MLLTFGSFAYGVPGFLRAMLWMLIVFVNLRYCKVKNTMDRIVFAYILGAFLSLSGMLIRPYPIDFFFKVLVDSYVPIVFYFVGKNTGREVQTTFYNRTLLAIIFVYVVGFYFLATMPSWYVEKSLEIINRNASYNEDTLQYARFGSFLDSYHVANMGVCALCFIFGLLKIENRSKVKLLTYIGLGIVIVAILLSRQRVAMFVGIVVMSFYILNVIKNKKSFVLISLALLFLVYLIPQLLDETTSSLVFGRFTKGESSGMVSQRVHQWIEALTGLMEPIFGNGIGSGGHIAVSHGMHPSIADGSYFKIWLEGGLYSTILFLVILYKSLLKAYLNRKYYYVEFPLLLFFACSLLGANIIDMPYIIAPMWYAIGRVNKNKISYKL